MNEIDCNRDAWSKLSRDHYETFRARLAAGEHRLNTHITREIGDLSGKRVLHLQCNTGADTILLAREAQWATGVDLSADNIRYARLLAREMGCENADFVESDVLQLPPGKRYDVVFTSEGVLGWLPTLAPWARVIREHLATGGFLYVFDSHPTMLMFDEGRLQDGDTRVRYPYSGREPDEDDSIGGYASDVRTGVRAFFWMHPFSEIVNSLAREGLYLERLNEFPSLYYRLPGMDEAEPGMYSFPDNPDRYPMSFSLTARLLPGQGD